MASLWASQYDFDGRLDWDSSEGEAVSDDAVVAIVDVLCTCPERRSISAEMSSQKVSALCPLSRFWSEEPRYDTAAGER